MPDLEISNLPPLAGSALEATDPLPIADLSASETKKITVKDLLQSGIALIDDKSIPGSKCDFTVPAGSVGTAELADGAVTAPKLAANSSATIGPTASRQPGAFIGQLHYDDTTGKATIWDGGTWQAWKAAGSINAIAADTTGVIRVTTAQTADSVAVDAEPAPTAVGGQFLAGPPTSGGAVTARAIVSSDLPKATTFEVGAVMVPLGQGLRINGGSSGFDASLEIANDVAGSGATAQLVTYNSKGLVTSGRDLEAGDIPVATTSAVGGISLGPEFAVGAGSELRHSNFITPGSATKVTFDAAGHVTSAAPLVAADIPGLDASKITSGEFDTTRIGYNSISAYQLADYGIAHVLQSRPVPEFAGQFWINPVDRSAYIWVGTVNGPESVENGYWMSIGYGSALDQTIRLGGTYDATNNTIESLNSIGTAAGLVVGQPLPSPMPANNGVYLLVTSMGQGVTPAPVEPLAVGDWVFSLGTGTNWQKISVISGAGGFVRDDDVLVEGTTFLPAMDGVVNQFEANRLMWNYVQVASGVERGTVKPTSEVLVDPKTAEMHIGVIDCGEY
jgi:hypothetical protein